MAESENARKHSIEILFFEKTNVIVYLILELLCIEGYCEKNNGRRIRY